MLVLCIVVEPAWTNAGVRLARTPHIALFYAIVQHLIRHLTIVVKQTPVGFAHITSFRSYPTQVASIATIVPDKTFGLQLANHLVGLRPLVVGGTINLARLVSTSIPAIASIGTIEPHFEDITIVRQQLAQLVAEVGDVFWSSIFRMVTIPRRKVDSKLETFLATSLSEFAHHITLTILPRRVLDGILCIGRGPHAETAMVLSRKDDASHASLFADSRPLTTIEIGGIEQLRILIAKAPLLIGIGVERVMDESIHLHILPTQLVGIGKRTTGRNLCLDFECQGRKQHQQGCWEFG